MRITIQRIDPYHPLKKKIKKKKNQKRVIKEKLKKREGVGSEPTKGQTLNIFLLFFIFFFFGIMEWPNPSPDQMEMAEPPQSSWGWFSHP
jgi:hypothetical protein